MKKDRRQVQKEEKALVLQKEVKKNVYKRLRESQKEEQEYDVTAGRAQIKQIL